MGHVCLGVVRQGQGLGPFAQRASDTRALAIRHGKIDGTFEA